MAYRMELIYDEIVDILDVKLVAGSTNGYTIPHGMYEISDLNLMIRYSFPMR